jgi:3-phenylpropionate/trans-cinnamate dioxygenase ferredoxin subunit
MARHVVATTSEIAPGANKVVTIGAREIVVFNIKGEYFALLNRCPHEGAPICKAALVAHIHSDEPGSYIRTREGEMLRCPWHGWEFDVRTGQSYSDPSHWRIRSYAVSVEPGETLAKGPYVAETFPVTVEESYVLVEA